MKNNVEGGIRNAEKQESRLSVGGIGYGAESIAHGVKNYQVSGVGFQVSVVTRRPKADNKNRKLSFMI